jgi:hypothetical protein
MPQRRCRAVQLLAAVGVLCTMALFVTTAVLGAEAEKSAESSQDATHPIAAALSPEPIEGPAVSVSWSITAASKYLWQGIDYSFGHRVAQPGATLGYGGFSATAWMNYDLQASQPNEFDFTLQREFDARVLTVAPGFTHYRYPHHDGWEPTSEVFLDLSSPLPLEPSLSVHYDYDAGKGIGQSVGPWPLGLHIAANLFYERGYYDLTGIPAVELNVSRDFGFGGFTVSPSISRFTTWDNGDFRDAARVPANWLFSLTVSQGE